MQKLVNSLSEWVRQPDLGLDLVRIYLGIALFVRGVMFVSHPNLVMRYLAGYDWAWLGLVGHYVALAHLAGGFLMAIGLVTRLAAGVQVPVLAAAVFLVHFREGLFQVGQSLELAALVLFLLVVFTIFGGGRLSADALMGRVRPIAQNEL